MAISRETAEQIAVFDFIRLNHDLFKKSFHIPNEGKRNIRTGALLKRMGMKAGVSDIMICKARQGYHGLFIELKALQKTGKYNKPTISQMQFIDDMTDEGYFATVANGARDAIGLITWYLGK